MLYGCDRDSSTQKVELSVGLLDKHSKCRLGMRKTTEDEQDEKEVLLFTIHVAMGSWKFRIGK